MTTATTTCTITHGGYRDDQQRDGAAEPVVHAAHPGRELGGEGGAVVGEPGEHRERQQGRDHRPGGDRDAVDVDQPPPQQHQRGQQRDDDQLPGVPGVAEPVDQRARRDRAGRRRPASSRAGRAGRRRDARRTAAARPAGSRRGSTRHSTSTPASVPSAIADAPAAPARSPIASRPGNRPDRAERRPAEHLDRGGEDGEQIRPARDDSRRAWRPRAARRRPARRAPTPARAAPRPRSSVPTTEVVSRDATMQVAAPTSPATTATAAGSGCDTPRDRRSPTETSDRRDAGDPGDPDQEHRGHQLPGAQREPRQLQRVEGLLDALEEQRHDDPAEHQRGAADHDDGLRRLRAGRWMR